MAGKRKPASVVIQRALLFLAGATTWSPSAAQDTPPPIPEPDPAVGQRCPVARVDDDCSVSVLIDGVERRIELCGVDVTPSSPARDELHSFLEHLLTGENVLVQFADTAGGESDTPQGAWLFRAPDGLFVNLETIRQGYATIHTRSAAEHLDLLRHYEQRAKKARKGVWAPTPRVERAASAARSGTASERPSSKADDVTVFVTKSGKKYHSKGCQHLRKSSRPISLKDALAKGYEPCSRCKPPTVPSP